MLDEPNTGTNPGEDIDIGHDLLKYIQLLTTGKNKERDRIILKLHLIDGFSPGEISAIETLKISPKRIANLISQFKFFFKKASLNTN